MSLMTFCRETDDIDQYLLVHYMVKDNTIYCLFELTSGVSRFGETPVTLSGWKVPRSGQKLENQLKQLNIIRKGENFQRDKYTNKLKQDIYNFANGNSEDDLTPFYIEKYSETLPPGVSYLKKSDFYNLFE